MNMPWLSIMGLMAHRPDVLDDFALPIAADMQGEEMVAHPWVPDRTDLKNYLCFALAELPLVYTDPDLMKTAVRVWSTIHYKEWVDLLRTLNYQFNPIWNKDGTVTEQRDITYEKAGTSSDSGQGSTTDTGTVGRSGSSSGSTEHQVTGYNTNAYSPDVKDVTSGSANETETRNLAGSSSATSSGTTSDEGESHDTFQRTEQGNIGVTSSQQLIREQRELVQFNFYEFLTQAFKREFCVMVW